MTNYEDRCLGCEKLFSEMVSFPALSRYGYGDLCSECGEREAFEGDFIRAGFVKMFARNSRTQH